MKAQLNVLLELEVSTISQSYPWPIPRYKENLSKHGFFHGEIFSSQITNSDSLSLKQKFPVLFL